MLHGFIQLVFHARIQVWRTLLSEIRALAAAIWRNTAGAFERRPLDCPFFRIRDAEMRLTALNRLMPGRRKTPSRLGAHSEITWASNVNRTWRIAPSCAGWTASGSQSRSRARRGRRRTRRAPTCEGCSPGGPVSCPATCWCPGWAGASLRRSSAGILRRDRSLCSASPAAWKSRREQSRSVIWESCTSYFFSLSFSVCKVTHPLGIMPCWFCLLSSFSSRGVLFFDPVPGSWERTASSSQLTAHWCWVRYQQKWASVKLRFYKPHRDRLQKILWWWWCRFCHYWEFFHKPLKVVSVS